MLFAVLADGEPLGASQTFGRSSFAAESGLGAFAANSVKEATQVTIALAS